MNKESLIGMTIVLVLFLVVFFFFIAPTLETSLGKFGVMIGAIFMLVIFGFLALRVLK